MSSGLKMFECLGDCADFDLVNGCIDSGQAQAGGNSAQQEEHQGQHRQGQQQQQQPDALDCESHSSRSYSDDEEDGSFYSQDEEERTNAAGQRTGEFDGGVPPPAHNSVGDVEAGVQGLSDSGALHVHEQRQKSDGVSSSGAEPGLISSGTTFPSSGGDSWKSGVSGDAVSAATTAEIARIEGGGAENARGLEDSSSYSSGTASAASLAALEAAEAGKRASLNAQDAVAAAAAAADARTQEEAQAAADRAARAAANAAEGAAGAARAASLAGRAAAAEQAAKGAVEMAGGLKPVNQMRRSVSSPDDGGEDSADSNGDRSMGDIRSSSVRSMPGKSEMMAAPTPGREAEGERTWVMAKRITSTWEKEDQKNSGNVVSPPDAADRRSLPRTFVSTRLRHLRLSPDGTTLVVKSDKGGEDHELALDELLEVHETPSEESVTLMGTDIEIRIAFKGQAKALKQFRNMLVPAGSGVTSNSSGSGGDDPSAATTITTIKEPLGSTASGAGAPPPYAGNTATTAGEQARDGAVSVGSSIGSSGGSLSASAPTETSRGSLGGRISGNTSQQQQHGLGGILEDSVSARSVPLSTEPPLGNTAVTNLPSPGSSVSGWGSVMGPGDQAASATQRQFTDMTDRASAAQTMALARSGNGRLKDSGGSSVGGSTFADARERELVIAALQKAEGTMPDVEREAKLHLVKYEQAGFVRGYEALCDQQQVRLRKRPEFSELEKVGSEEGLADPSIVLRQANTSDSVDVHYSDAVRAKAALDSALQGVTDGTTGLWLRPVEVKDRDSIKRKAVNDYEGDVRRVLDMARTSVICDTPELVQQLIEKLKTSEEVSSIGRIKNGFGSTAIGRGGYRDIKVNLVPRGVNHYVEVQVHLREFYELNSRSHEVYEWARGVDLPDGTTPHLLFRNLTPDVQEEMTELVKNDWMGLRRILPELLQATERYNEAEPLLRQNVVDAERRWKIAKDTFGEGHLHEISCAQGVAMALNNLALALKGRGDTDGAEPLLRKALQMSIDSQGAEHPEVATRLNSLALLLASDGRVEEAEELHRRALDIAIKVYGPEHADVATYLNNLARVLKAQDKLAEAEPLQRSALAIGERMLGSNHSDVATYYNNLSRLVRAAGKLEEAEPLQRRAVEIGEQVLGPNSPDLATWVNNLGRLLMARKKLVEAEKVQERAVTIAENVYGPHHAQVARARKNLTKVRWALGKAGRSR